ncbi:hypothetical protein LOK49_LG11G00665 [Camellia lanceoleosa]|uniref:Uncharacterized protein n=1 Tax=Camellia lanceoleosa TaxID=1840588 RepID=A0ACC0FY70_9ERIC|nr:hypothetical protein LOK49_LG11G00665 [Camellia lanceoleosa]
MKKDLDDLKFLVLQVVEKYLTKDGSEDEPIALSLFFHLENEFPGPSINGGTRTYAYFMYDNPLFDDGNDRYNMIHKFWDYSMINKGNLCTMITLNKDTGYMIN